MNLYYRIRFSNLSAANEEIVATYSIEHGATGVSEVLEFTQPDLTYEPRVAKRRCHDIDVYFMATPPPELFEEIKKIDSSVTWQIFEEQHRDWLEEWKKGFVPFPLTSQVWIVPSWLDKPAEAPQQIRIDPGMAFGTGTHATTKMAAHFIGKFAEKNKDRVSNMSLLDVGTGTAILAMLARLYGFQRVKGIDIDPEAQRVSQDNIALNILDKIEITAELLEEVKEQFDVVMANIIDGVLIQLQNDLVRVMKPRGQLFVSGILLEREALFFEKFIEAQNLKVVRRLEKDEWVGFWLERGE